MNNEQHIPLVDVNVAVIDSGNSHIKAINQHRVELTFPHALVQLSDGDYANIASRVGESFIEEGYVRVNGVPYAFGKMALRHLPPKPPEGAARYTAEHYGVLAAITIAQLHPRGGKINVFGSHAPRDVQFRKDLIDSIMGQWLVESPGQSGESSQFTVTFANAFDEPLGAWFNTVVSWDGKQAGTALSNAINAGRTLVIDIGGLTTDFLGIGEDGVVEYTMADSVVLGIKQVIVELRRGLTAAYPDLFKMASNVNEMRLQEALRTGVFIGGGREYPCHEIAKQARNYILSQIVSSYHTVSGGGLNFDSILVAGGGGAALFEHIGEELGHGAVYAADDLETLQFATARGGMKLFKVLYERGHFGG